MIALFGNLIPLKAGLFSKVVCL